MTFIEITSGYFARWSKEKSRSGMRLVILSVLMILAILMLPGAITLAGAERQAPDTLLVLGGTANRERYAALLIKEHPERRVLIAGGSEDPCIWLIFDKAGAPKSNVWMEHCSRNTFENFIYAAPILRQWHTHKVLLITDLPHAYRALPVGRIILGAKGIWVDLVLVPNSGGESWRRPLWLDIIFGCLWAVASQVVQPCCSNVTHLSDIDMKYWYRTGFYCPPQAQVEECLPAR